MNRWSPPRVYSGAVRGEVVIQGDLNAQGDINIVIDSARTAYRAVVESPQIFGPMQTKVQDAIKTLLAVSQITSEYLDESRLDGSLEQELRQLSQECRSHLIELQGMRQEFETMDTQAFRQNDLGNLTESLEAKVKGLENINDRVNVSVLQLEKALKKYIAQVKHGDCASSIRSSVSSISASSTMSQKEWRQIQNELASVGITASQFNNNREKILKMLGDAFQEDLEEVSPVRTKKMGQLNRLLSSLSRKGKDLLAAAENGNSKEAKSLLAKGAYVDTKSSNGFTPLLIAVEKQNSELAELFLSYNADVDKKANSAYSSCFPLLYAVQHHNMELTELLLHHGAKVNQTDLKHTMALHVAVKVGDIGIVNTLLDHGADVSAESSTLIPATALGLAIDQSSFSIVVALVEHNSDVNQSWRHNEFRKDTPLLFALWKGQLNIIEYLLQKGAHVDQTAQKIVIEAKNMEHLRLLLTFQPEADLSNLALVATKAGNEDALRLVIEKGADINANPQGAAVRSWRETPVWLAAAAGHHSILNLLLTKGADIEKGVHPKDCRDHEKKSCLFTETWVRKCTAVQIAVSHSHWECARLLISYRGDLNAWVHTLSGVPQRLLHFVANNSVDPSLTLRAFADIGADMNLGNEEGQTPLHTLHWLPYYGDNRITVARALVKNGAKVDYQDDKGRTPLHIAVEWPLSDEIIEFLLESGADPNARDKRGATPLHYAGEEDNKKAFKLLIEAGGKADIVDDENRPPRIPHGVSTDDL